MMVMIKMMGMIMIGIKTMIIKMTKMMIKMMIMI
jgi:hypothetical protein